jgi:mRNA interferase RelE/StbE
MTRAALYAITFTPSARRLLGKLPLSVPSALFEHLTGPVADNPYRLSKPSDAPFDDVRAARRGDYRVYTSSMTAAVPSRCWQLPTVATPTGHGDLVRAAEHSRFGPGG